MARVGGGAGATKADVRAQVRSARTTRSSDQRARDGAALARHAAGLLPASGTVAVHLSLPTEPPTGPLLAASAEAGCTVLVPRVVGDRLAWVRWRADVPTTRGPFGIEEPDGPEVPDALREVDVVLLPALSVDRAGHRLGQGGGFYDRALADVPTRARGGPLRVACVYAEEVVDAVPHEPHDIRVDLALTPDGVVTLG